MDSESRAAAGLLEALSRASEIFAELHHPFARSRPFSYYVPPSGARIGTVFTLPDGREVSFTVSISTSADAWHVEGEASVEDEVLIELPRKSTPDVRAGLAVLDAYVGEVAAPSIRLLDGLLDGITGL
ncbi:hypothetical protein ACIBG8_27365 [Nonomuraea sp. NPDC050556]|uniref:hypothetical protein n=1 Tax=Nonomuraea sp. NPDC050556 TaxID=3364369 RepID=UPI0037B5F4D6